MNAAGERVTDLVGPASQRQGHDDQVAGGTLDQGHARTGPIFTDDDTPLPVARDGRILGVVATRVMP